MFNNTWLFRYLCPRKVVFDNGSEFKQDFNPLLKDFNIKTFLTSVKNPQANSPIDQLHQVILNILVTKELYKKIFEYIDPWGETLAFIAWAIRDSYHRTTMSTPFQAVYGIFMLFYLALVIDWRVVTAAKQRQVDIDNVRENTKRVTRDYEIGDQLYVEMTGI